jgi:hypothetical protein
MTSMAKTTYFSDDHMLIIVGSTRSAKVEAARAALALIARV